MKNIFCDYTIRTEDGDQYIDTECGHSEEIYFRDALDTHFLGFVYCPYCGKKVTSFVKREMEELKKDFANIIQQAEIDVDKKLREAEKKVHEKMRWYV